MVENLRITINEIKLIVESIINEINSSETFNISNTMYDNVFKLGNDIYGVKLDGKYNIINADEELLSPVWFDRILPFKNGKAPIIYKGRPAFIDMQGNIYSLLNKLLFKSRII